MNFDTNTTKYSAFAIVAIESVWPNPEGNEAPPDLVDFELLGVDPEQTSRSGVKRESFQSAQFSQSEGDYQRSKGYYKILPLNILRVDTTSNLGGSQFAVSFTLDDLLLVADKDVDFLNATGLPFKTQDLIDLGNDKTLPTLLDTSDKSWDYVRDEELGLNRYRITGDSSQFNVEDLVEPNDTVTIWIYHDPSDFYLKDSILPLNEETLDISDEISTVVGSADRRSQYSDSTRDFSEYVLSTLGLLDKFSGAAIEGTLESSRDFESPSPSFNFEVSQNILLSREEVLNAVINFGLEAVQTRGLNEETEETFEFYSRAFGLSEDSPAYRHVIKPYVLPDADTTASEAAADVAPIDQRDLIINTGRALWDDENKEFTPDRVNSPQVQELDNLTEAISAYQVSSPDNETNLRNLAIGLQQFKGILEQQLLEYNNKFLTGEKNYSVLDQRFTNGRRMLVNDFSGETPYLAIKGKISDIKVNIGHQTGSHTVTISGQGYEKTLKEQEVFYEDLFFPEAPIAIPVEYQTLYMNVSPARVLVDVINRHASRNLVFKSADKQVTLADGSTERLFIDDPNFLDVAEQVDFFGNNQVLSRGNYVYKEFKTEIDREDARVFHPINFIETTRVYEMVRALDLSFEQEEALFRNARRLRGRTSVFQNLKALGGTEQFYEMFVDETGRFRYRFTFEAYEKTPNLAITPLIDDTKLLSGALFGVTDSALSTVVDVFPSDRVTSNTSESLLAIGRALPEVGEVPIQNISFGDNGQSVNVDDLLSPDFFRYGLQTLQIEDVYTAPANAPKRRALFYHNVYGKPLKNAKISLINDTSYRVGNTVLVSLQKNKYRSKKIIDTQKFVDWLKYLRDNDSESTPFIDMYIGIDERLVNKDAYTPTRGEYAPIPGGFYSNYEDVESAKSFVLEQFISTFEFLKDEVGLSVITPEFFPNTFWYYNLDEDGGEDFLGDVGRIPSSKIREFYLKTLNSFANNSKKEFVGSTSASESRLQNGVENVLNLADTEFTGQKFTAENSSSGVALDAEANVLYDRLNNEQRLIALFEQASDTEVYGNKALANPLNGVKTDLESNNFEGALKLSRYVYNLLKYNDGNIETAPSLENQERNLNTTVNARNESFDALQSLRGEFNNLNSKLEDVETLKAENESSLSDKEQVLNTLEIEIDRVKTEKEDLESKDNLSDIEQSALDSLNIQFNNLEVQITNTNNEITALKNDIAFNEERISELQGELSTKEVEISDAQRQYDSDNRQARFAALEYRELLNANSNVPIYSTSNLAPLENFINEIESLSSQKESIQEAEVTTNEASLADDVIKNPGIINALKFQNFRAASYYIESVSHRFEHGRSAVTNLQLNYGQDNLMLLEPKNNIPIGFISIERFLKIGFDSDNDNFMFNEDGTLSGEQKLYIEQFKQDKNYLRGSLLYQSQKLRNSANYMRQLALMDDLDVTITDSTIVQQTAPGDDILEIFNDTLQQNTNDDILTATTEVDTRGINSQNFWGAASSVILDLESRGYTINDSVTGPAEQRYNNSIFESVSRGGSIPEDETEFIKNIFNDILRAQGENEPYPDASIVKQTERQQSQSEPVSPQSTPKRTEGSPARVPSDWVGKLEPTPRFIEIVNITDLSWVPPESQNNFIFNQIQRDEFKFTEAQRRQVAKKVQDNYIYELFPESDISSSVPVSKEFILDELQSSLPNREKVQIIAQRMVYELNKFYEG